MAADNFDIQGKALIILKCRFVKYRSKRFWVFAFWMIFFHFSKKSDFWVFLVHPETTLPDGLESFLRFGWFFPFFKKNGFWGILGPPSYGIGAIIRSGREMLCFPYAGFFIFVHFLYTSAYSKSHTTRYCGLQKSDLLAVPLPAAREICRATHTYIGTSYYTLLYYTILYYTILYYTINILEPHTILYIYWHLILYSTYIGTSYYTIHILAPHNILYIYWRLILYYTYIGTSYYTILILAPHTILYIY